MGGGNMAWYWIGVFFSFWFFLGMVVAEEEESDKFGLLLASLLGALLWFIVIPLGLGAQIGKGG